MKNSSLKQVQKMVDDWINQFEEGYWPPLSMLASLMEEVGELAREINDREKNQKEKGDRTRNRYRFRTRRRTIQSDMSCKSLQC